MVVQPFIYKRGGGSGGWQPDPLWTNIRTLYDNDPLASTYQYRAVYLIAGQDEATEFPAGSFYQNRRYITSDGYDSGGTLLTAAYTHIWDLTKDIIDSKGARIRWIKVYSSNPTAIVSDVNYKHSVIWAVFNLSATVVGDTAQYSTGFNHCYALRRFECGSNVTSVGNYAFRNCSSLESIVMTSTITSIGNYAFDSCYGLVDCFLPYTVTAIGTNAFQNCYSLSDIVIPSGVTTLGASIFSACYSLSEIVIPSGVTTLGASAFSNCQSAVKLSIPSSVTSATSTSFSNTFSLQNVVLETNFDANLTLNSGNTNAASTRLSRSVLNAMIAAYKDNSGGTARTLTIGATNLAKLTAEDIAVATDKNLSLA